MEVGKNVVLESYELVVVIGEGSNGMVVVVWYDIYYYYSSNSGLLGYIEEEFVYLCFCM